MCSFWELTLVNVVLFLCMRDSYLGQAYPNFQKIFVQKRKATMPSWVDASRLNHFFRLSVNTKVAASEVGKTLEVGKNINSYR